MKRLAAALSVWILVCFDAGAGQTCEARKLTPRELQLSLQLAANTVRHLEQSGAKAAIIARAGQDLREYHLRYSHLGIAYRDDSALDGRGAWRVVHKLNECGSSRGNLYRQGIADFFGDTLHRHEAGIVILAPELQAEIVRTMGDNQRLGKLHQPRYNMLAYPWSTQYQQSNQWAIETLAMVASPANDTRRQAQTWLRIQGYRPTTLAIPPLKRLGASIGTAHIAFDDHPLGRRMAGQIDTVTVDSVFAWLERSRHGRRPEVVGSAEAAPHHQRL